MPTTPKSFAYDAEVVWGGGRRSVVSAGDRAPIEASPPEDFPDGDATRWSPEHLFLGALSSCTLLSFLSHAEHRDVEVRSYSASVTGRVERRAEDGRYAFVSVHLRPRVTVAPGSADAARALTGKAERDCFITASTTAEVRVDWEIEEA